MFRWSFCSELCLQFSF